MRTTLDIDEDVLLAAKELARLRKQTMGEVLSELAREALTHQKDVPATRNDVPLFPKQAQSQVVTMELVNRLRDEQP